MKDAFGGVFMIKIFLVFIIIYVGFTALALNYAKAYKVKNKVIDYIEDNEMGNIKDKAVLQDALQQFVDTEIISGLNYNVDFESSCNAINGIYIQGGVCIETKNASNNTVYYKVTTKVGWSVPFINKLLAVSGNENDRETVIGTWTISGETRIIVKN